MTGAAGDLLQRWERQHENGAPFDALPEMSKVALDVVCRAMFGTDILERADAFHHAVNEALELCPVQVRSLERRGGDGRSPEVRAREVGAPEVAREDERSPQVGPAEVRLLQVAIEERGALELDPDERGSRELGIAEAPVEDPRQPEIGPVEVGPLEDDAAVDRGTGA